MGTMLPETDRAISSDAAGDKSISDFSGFIDCEGPNNRLYTGMCTAGCSDNMGSQFTGLAVNRPGDSSAK